MKEKSVFFPVLKFGSREKPTSFLFCLFFFDPLLCPEMQLAEASMEEASGTFMALRLFFWVLLSLRLLFLLLLLSLFVLLYLFSLLVLLAQMVFLFVDLVVVPPKTTADALPAWQSMTMPPYAMSFGPLGFVMTVTLMKMMVFFGDDDIDQSGIGKNRYWYWCRVAEYVLYVCGVAVGFVFRFPAFVVCSSVVFMIAVFLSPFRTFFPASHSKEIRKEGVSRKAFWNLPLLYLPLGLASLMPSLQKLIWSQSCVLVLFKLLRVFGTAVLRSQGMFARLLAG